MRLMKSCDSSARLTADEHIVDTCAKHSAHALRTPQTLSSHRK